VPDVSGLLMICPQASTYHTAMYCQCSPEERLVLTSGLCTKSAIMSRRQGPVTVKGEEVTPHQIGVLVLGVGGTVQELEVTVLQIMVVPMQHQCKPVAMELPIVGKLMEVRLSISILTVQAYVFGIQCMP